MDNKWVKRGIGFFGAFFSIVWTGLKRWKEMAGGGGHGGGKKDDHGGGGHGHGGGGHH
ncbi:MAG: hypothetical protein AB199_00450 [Parcubacteria bacterium C7867-004]|nr:MAG: hypothetical protein AB199_00450 [Parcubacteria bacterium C7867-004]